MYISSCVIICICCHFTDYRVGSVEYPLLWSSIFLFRTRPLDEANWTPRLAVYGDLGVDNGVSIPYLVEQVASRAKYDLVIHNVCVSLLLSFRHTTNYHFLLIHT